MTLGPREGCGTLRRFLLDFIASAHFREATRASLDAPTCLIGRKTSARPWGELLRASAARSRSTISRCLEHERVSGSRPFTLDARTVELGRWSDFTLAAGRPFGPADRRRDRGGSALGTPCPLRLIGRKFSARPPGIGSLRAHSARQALGTRSGGESAPTFDHGSFAGAGRARLPPAVLAGCPSCSPAAEPRRSRLRRPRALCTPALEPRVSKDSRPGGSDSPPLSPTAARRSVRPCPPPPPP